MHKRGKDHGKGECVCALEEGGEGRGGSHGGWRQSGEEEEAEKGRVLLVSEN